MIFEPGRKTRLDIHTITSGLDVLPTMLHVTGQDSAAWAEGTILPPYRSADPDPNRSVYLVKANKNGQYEPLSRASVTLTKGKYKLHYYFGYKERGIDELIKLFDIEADPEELTDLSLTQKGIATELFNEIKIKLTEVNKPYI